VVYFAPAEVFCGADVDPLEKQNTGKKGLKVIWYCSQYDG